MGKNIYKTEEFDEIKNFDKARKEEARKEYTCVYIIYIAFSPKGSKA